MSDILVDIIKEAILPFKEAILPSIREAIKEEFRSIQKSETQEKLLSVDQARKMFDPEVSRGTIYNWINEGLIESYMIGGRRCLKYSELIEAVKRVKKYQHNRSEEK